MWCAIFAVFSKKWKTFVLSEEFGILTIKKFDELILKSNIKYIKV
jgi:hypothetical protein